LVLLLSSVVVLEVFARGSLSSDAGSNGILLGLLGVAGMTMWIAPRAAAVLIRGVTTLRPDVGRLLGADVRRYGVLFAISAAVLALGASLAVGSHTMQILGTAQVAAQKAELLPATLLVSPQSVLDQSNGHLARATAERIGDAAAGRPTAERWRSTISTGTSSRLVIGVSPGDWYSTVAYTALADAAGMWRGLRAGDVALSEITATRMGAAVGDRIALPTVSGIRQYRVAGIFEPRLISNSAVGDIVLTSADTARSDWAAVLDQVAIRYSSSDAAAAHRSALLEAGADLTVYDDETWRTAAAAGITRFFEPFTAAGYVVMSAAGLSVLNVFVLGLVQRRRERAVLRALGVTQRHEQSVLIAHAGLLVIIVSVAGGLGGLGLTYLQSLGSPANYGIQIAWGISATSLVAGVSALTALIGASAVVPVIHAGRLNMVDQLRTTG